MGKNGSEICRGFSSLNQSPGSELDFVAAKLFVRRIDGGYDHPEN